ncbi:MAG: hypothetical protein ACLSG5_17365 [Oscillospiraceae bacterium]
MHQNWRAGAAKTFTQDEVNDLIKSRLERERRDFPARRIAAFHKWQDDRNPQSRSPRKLSRCSQTARTPPRRKPPLWKRATRHVKGVKPDAADDVVALASLKVSDDMRLKRQSVLKSIRSLQEVQHRQQQGFRRERQRRVSGVEAAFRAKNGIKFW